MDENSSSKQTSQKLNYWKYAFFIVLFLLIVTNGLLFYFFKINNQNLTVDPPKNLRVITNTVTPSPQPITTNNSLSLPLELLSLTNGEKLNFNQVYKILWRNQGLERWGDEIIVCLIGFDSSGEEIPAKKEWNEQLCTYRTGDLSGSYLIAMTKLSSGIFDWTIPVDLFNRYISQPTKFKIRLLVFDNLPAEGRTEWAGNVGWDESKDYLFIESNL